MDTLIYLASVYYSENDLQHYGVKGMHWGERKAEARLNESIRNRNAGYGLATKYDNAMANKVIRKQSNYQDALKRKTENLGAKQDGISGALLRKQDHLRLGASKVSLERAKHEQARGKKTSDKNRKLLDKDVAKKQAKLDKIKARNEKINNSRAMEYADATVTNYQIKRERKHAYKNRAKMSDQELRDMTNRINAENNLKNAINGSDSKVVSGYKQAVVTAVVGMAMNYTVRKVLTPQNLIKVLA